MLAITVDTLIDELDSSIVDGDISLRDAIAAASPGETIDFAVTGAIDLDPGLGQLDINQDLTIEGPGANLLEINALGNSRVVYVANGLVDISGLTITGGRVLAFGGGIFNDGGSVTVNSSTLSGNWALAGGGVASNQMLTISSSTLSGNTANTNGGGILNDGGTAAIINSTLSGNSANFGAGIVTFGGAATIKSSTLTGNLADNKGGGLYNYTGAATVTDSVVSGNTAVLDGNEIMQSASGTTDLDTYNLIGDSSQSTADALTGVSVGGTTITAISNGTNPTALTSIFETTLADNGGPTLTHALVAGSPAIDAGNPGALAGVGGVPQFDQRGAPFGRVADGRIDIGAHEAQLNLVADTLVDESDGDFSMGDLSLREALQLTNANPGADTVTLDASLAGATINLLLGQLTISDDVTVTGLGADQLTIDAAGNSRVMRVTGTTTAEISGLTLTGGQTDRGGALRNSATLVVQSPHSPTW